MDTLYFPPFPYFSESAWEAASPTVFSSYILSQIVFDVLGASQTSMASMGIFPKAFTSPTHDASLVPTRTLWCCTSRQNPCIPLNFLTLDPIDIKLFFYPCLYLLTITVRQNVDCLTQKNRDLINC